jgi:UDP-N-acetylglucosamine diphosphorylase / glucose-1-phosphate thymidylyltransferase / UDP-N-acetylgalactosamine diphosphorylase / glucosamine-1-phosphate N-acetyltransferase / galactosamine-1-phosphate N-acetyltransferase
MSIPALIILAGGASSRMWPLREKSLIRFGAEPLLVTQLQTYRKLGFERIVIVGNPENETMIRERLAALPMQTTVVVQREPKGMGDALLQTESVLSRDEAIYITQVHDVVDETLHTELLKAHGQRLSETYLAGAEMQEYFPGGYFRVDADLRILGMVEKPGAENRPSNFVNIVAHIHPNAGVLFDAIRAEYERAALPDDHYERAMDRLMKSQVYRVVPYQGRWSALKYPFHVLDIMEHFLSRLQGQMIAPSAYIAPGASITGNVFIGENVRVFPGAAVVGPAYIGDGTIVGNNALVRASMVLEKCEVGYTTEIARSYVAERVGMHACRVLDSVIAAGANISAGCTTANMRIDRGTVSTIIKGQKIATGRSKFGLVAGQDAFLAVDVMTMPGVKIGERTQVGPGTHVHHDLPDRKRVYVKQELVVVDES